MATPSQNTSLRLLYSHSDLNRSNAQIWSWLFAGEGAAARSLWVFRRSSPFQGAAWRWFCAAAVRACAAGAVRTRKVPLASTVPMAVFSLRKTVAHCWVLLSPARCDKTNDKRVFCDSRRDQSDTAASRLWRQWLFCMYSSSSAIQYNKRARCIIVFGVLCLWFETRQRLCLINTCSSIRRKTHREKMPFWAGK